MCKNQRFRKIQVASIFSVNWRAWRGASQVRGGLGNLVRSSEDLDLMMEVGGHGGNEGDGVCTGRH